MRTSALICLFSGLFFIGYAQDKTAYIETYKSIAISEMLRTGIPASIKLAQAIHESACGKSDLACKANNHFGIKCGNDWSGKQYNKEDDDYAEGKLVKSCFREFRTVYDSYIAHSEFLIDPAKAKRYGFLFELEQTDYKGWARGLAKAGYATDPQYANKIIDLIEKYELYQYDSGHENVIASKKPKESRGRELLLSQNDVRYALAVAGDTPFSFAERNDITVKQVIRYNDDVHNEDQVLEEGSIVYLQPKRNSYRGNQKVHLLKPGEDLVSISQKYGIKLEALIERNGLSENEIPAPNQKIALKGKPTGKIRTVNPYDIPTETKTEELVISQPETTAMASVKNTVVTQPKELPKKEVVPPVTVQQPLKKEHIVAKGETLYSVARQYSLSLDELKKMNNLSADTIIIGQKLIVK
ncbi:MAG TPA: glucosaminidase domain-containing protein [Saprospiraceae bacterium]|nr:glucosaminidase domain-containing protein [Saprospiraceae bacterium]